MDSGAGLFFAKLLGRRLNSPRNDIVNGMRLLTLYQITEGEQCQTYAVVSKTMTIVAM